MAHNAAMFSADMLRQSVKLLTPFAKQLFVEKTFSLETSVSAGARAGPSKARLPQLDAEGCAVLRRVA